MADGAGKVEAVMKKLGAAPCKLTEVALKGAGLTAEQVQQLGAALATNTSVTSLDLSQNDLESAGAAVIAEALKANQAITKVNLSSTKLRDEGSKLVAEALLRNKTVSTLVLCSNKIGVSDQVTGFENGAIALVEMLKVNRSLTALDLSNNYLRDVACKAFAAMLPGNKTLAKLNLRENGFGPVAADALSQGLASNRALDTLHIRGNNMTNEAESQLKAFAPGRIVP